MVKAHLGVAADELYGKLELQCGVISGGKRHGIKDSVYRKSNTKTVKKWK